MNGHVLENPLVYWTKLAHFRAGGVVFILLRCLAVILRVASARA